MASRPNTFTETYTARTVGGQEVQRTIKTATEPSATYRWGMGTPTALEGGELWRFEAWCKSKDDAEFIGYALAGGPFTVARYYPQK